MENCLSGELAALSRLSPSRVAVILESESRQLELTKSLLNLLFNIVKVESVEATGRQKEVLEKYEAVVWTLLAPSLSLAAKKRLLQQNIPLVIAIAESCPL